MLVLVIYEDGNGGVKRYRYAELADEYAEQYVLAKEAVETAERNIFEYLGGGRL